MHRKLLLGSNASYILRTPLHAQRHSAKLHRRQSADTCCVVQAAPAFAPTASSSVDFDIPRGETAGAAMIMENVTVQVGDRDLLEDVSWRLMPGQRVGFVGANGAGKSTLLKCMCGLRKVDAGRIVLASKVQLGYLEQTAVSGSSRTVWEEARSRMTALVNAEAALQQAEEALHNGHPKAAEMLQAAQEAFEAAGGYDADKRIANVLTGLGFKQEQWHKKASEFSGGWQMRIALARLLLGPAGQGAASGDSGGLLLLDEPTNHLDSAAIRWLGNFLRNSSGGVVIVSHDEDLLESACDRIVEVRGRKLHHFASSYSGFLEQRKMREEQALATAAAQQEEIARLEEFVARFGAKASKASQAQSRAKQLGKLRENAIEVPVASSSAGPGDAKKVTLKLPPAPPCNQEVLIVKGAAVGWGTPAPNEAPLLKGIDLVVKKGQRILVLGPNGAGKSTLLKALAGSLQLWGGSRRVGDGTKISVFSQDLAQDLPLDMCALDYVMEAARQQDPGIPMEKCRQALGALGLTGSMALQKIGVLSGGEKARVALATFALVPCNVLLLDEASNHLDAATINVLTGALQEFKGAIVAITHNKAFAESLNATHILRVQDGTAKLTDNLGLVAADFEHTAKPAPKSSSTASSTSTSSSAASSSSNKGGSSSKGKGKGKNDNVQQGPSTSGSSSSGSSPAKESRKRTTLSYKEQIEYQKLSKELEKLTAQRDQVQERVTVLAQAGGSDLAALEAASTELAALAEKVDSMEMRWLELAELAGDI